jgi:hypothetical protein
MNKMNKYFEVDVSVYVSADLDGRHYPNLRIAVFNCNISTRAGFESRISQGFFLM